MDEHPGDVFEDVKPADGEELERDETYVPGNPDEVVDLAAGEGSEADRLGGDDDLPGEPPADPLAEPEERSAGDPTPTAAEASAPTPAPEPKPAPEPEAPAPAPEPVAPEPEPAAAATPEPAPAPTPTPAPAPAKAEKGEKGSDTRSYLVFLYSADHPSIMHLQMKPVPEGQEEAEPEPLTIEATNWDRAMKIAYRQFAPDGGAIGIAVCPVRNFRSHVVSEKPREAPSNSIHFG